MSDRDMTKMTEEELLQALAERGIQIEIGGCGCCGSPWVTVVIDGEKVFDEQNADMSSITPTPETKQ